MLKDLAVLTPPLLVCVAFLIAVAAFLRHEMAAKQRRRDRDRSGDISAADEITDRGECHAPARRDGRQVASGFDDRS